MKNWYNIDEQKTLYKMDEHSQKKHPAGVISEVQNLVVQLETSRLAVRDSQISKDWPIKAWEQSGTNSSRHIFGPNMCEEVELFKISQKMSA